MLAWRLLLGCLLAGALAGARAASPEPPRPTPFESGERWGYRDQRGKVLIPPRYSIAQGFSREGVAAVVDERGWAWIDSRGTVLARPFVIDNGPDEFHEGLARFVRSGKVGFIDGKGRKSVGARFDFALPFREGLAAVCVGCSARPEGEHTRMLGGRWGFIDTTGKLAIPLSFDEAEPFEDGKARVKQRGRWLSIDRKGSPLPSPAE